MIVRLFGLAQVATFLATFGAASMLAGCGRTLVFMERDGVNLAVRTTGTTPPLEINFGLNRTIATIVPPAGEKSGNPSGDAVSMFAGFQVDNTFVPKTALDADLQVDTQFASGKAAIAVAGKPSIVADIVSMTAGAKLAAQTDTAIEVVIAAMSCDEKRTIDPALRDKLIAAANAPAILRDKNTPDDFRKAVRNSPSIVDDLYAAASKQGSPTCQKK